MRLTRRSGFGLAVSVFQFICLLAVLLVPSAQRALAEEGSPKVVAVAPFRVHSAQPLEYLATSLPDLLASRLAASDELGLVELDAVSKEIDALGSSPSEADLQGVARNLSADVLITGSLTELSGKFSLDVRMIPADATGESVALVYTAATEGELLERINELSETVLARVARVARSRIRQVAITGAEELGVDLMERIDTKPGLEYDGDAVRLDVERLMELPEIARATVDTERTPEGVIVTFAVIPSQQIMVDPSFDGRMRIVDVVIRGNRRIETAAILARIQTRPGDYYDQRRISADIREIFSLGFFRNVKVLREQRDDGRIVIFEIEENPVVRQVSILGNDKVDSDEIRDALTLTTGASLDYPLLHENVARIEALYRSAGYYLAKVRFEIEPMTEGAVSVNFEVTENDKLKLRKIVFDGNEHFSDRELRKGFKTKKWRFYSFATSFFDKTGTYSEGIFVQDLRRIEKRYMNDGFLQVNISEPNVIPHKKGLDVIVSVMEGRRFSVGEIAVEGDETMDVPALEELVHLEQGEIFDRSELTSDVESLERHYTDRGYYFARVNPRTDLTTDSDAVSVTFEVEKGPLYFVRQIEFEGNTSTVDEVLRREMRVVEGELYSARKLRQSQGRIDRLGYFEEVNVEPKPVEGDRNEIDLGIRVVEKPTGAFSVGAGYSSADSFIFTGSISQANLFGRGYSVQLSADIGGTSNRFYLSLSDPYIFDSQWSLGGTIFMTDVEFEDFEQSQEGITLTLGHPLDLEFKSRGFLTYTFANREITEDDDILASSMIHRQRLDGEQSISMIGMSVRSDTRNDRLAPTSGMQMGASLEFAGLGGFTEFIRTEAKAEWYYPLPEWMPWDSSFKLAGKVGYALPFNDVSDWAIPTGYTGTPPASAAWGQAKLLGDIDDDLKLPLTERYFMGGLGTFQLRGYKSRSVGPRRAQIYHYAEVLDPGPPVVSDPTGYYLPAGVAPSGTCTKAANQDDGDGLCNSLDDRDDDDFDDLDETDVIGGNKFISLTTEYRFTIAESLGLLGVIFIDGGNSFAEGDNLFDVGQWRYGTGVGVQWFSPFGPLEAYLGFPLNKLSVEDSMVFEFSMGGSRF